MIGRRHPQVCPARPASGSLLEWERDCTSGIFITRPVGPFRALFKEGGGQVEEVKIVTDRETGRPRGFGLVELASDAEAEAAVGALNGKDFGGRPLTVSEARDRMAR